MIYRNLGSSGLKVSLSGLGCNNFGRRIDYDASLAVVGAALECGVNFFDTARLYGDGKSEEFLGRALGSRRADAIIATKFGMEGEHPDAGASRRYIFQSVERSLKALGTDWIDLFQLHRPDPATPVEETLDALNTLIDQGKVRYIGCSNLTGWQLADAHWTAASRRLQPFVTAQNEWSLLKRGIEREVVPACEHFGLGILPYFPLSSGLLTGKARRGSPPPEGSRLAMPNFARVLTDANFDRLERLETWSAEHGRSLLETSLSWLASHPVVSSVIAGATKPEQVRANAAAVRDDLTPQQIDEIGELAGAPAA